jgi:hypothetical protein
VINICKTSINILDTFVFLYVLAEWATTLLNVSEFILILHEELTTFFTQRDGYIRYHVLVVLAREVRAKL